MDRYDIEKHVMSDISSPIDEVITRAVRNINAMGYHFNKVDDEIGIWRDDDKQLELDITAILTVSCMEIQEEAEEIDDAQKEIEDRFYAIAEEGTVREISILTSFEADIANGGFDQLYDNKGLKFIEEAIVILESIGSRTKLRLSKEALGIMRKYEKSIKQYEEYQKSLSKFDGRYDKSKENIPIIYNRAKGV